MFTWVCSTCGKELDVSVTECPECKGRPTAPPLTVPTASPAASRNPFRLRLALVAGLAVVGLIWLVLYQSRRPASPPRAASKPMLTLQPVPEAAAAIPAPPHQVEVAGVRLSYDAQDKPQVRAVVINHGEEELRNATLAVSLRNASARPDSPPLARFTTRIAGALKPGDSKEIKAPLEAFATLAAMPPWRQLRADVELK